MFKIGLQEIYSSCQTKRDKCNLSIIEYSLAMLTLNEMQPHRSTISGGGFCNLAEAPR